MSYDNEDINLNNSNRIINCREGVEQNDVATMKNLSLCHLKGLPIDMRNNKITNVAEGSR